MAPKPMIAGALAKAGDETEGLDGLSAALLASLRTAGSGRPAMTPSKDYAVAYPGTACQPMRGAR